MRKVLWGLLIAFVCFLVFAPLIQLLFAALSETGKLAHTIQAAREGRVVYASPFMFPLPPSLEALGAALNPLMLRQWGNSFLYAAVIALIQCAISLPAGFLFAKVRFIGKHSLFFIVTVVMLLPFQVVMLPGYIILDHVGLLDNPISILLPGMFAPFGVFFFRQFIAPINNEIIEIAQIEGASWNRILFRIVYPSIRPALFVFLLLSFLQSYAAVEPVLVYLRSAENMPLGVALRILADTSPESMFAPSLLYMLPPLLVFAGCSFGLGSLRLRNNSIH
jgi:ABC-type glycerol-3-phosphate transport system permease component